MKNTTNLNIRISPELKSELEKKAAEKGLTPSAYIKMLIKTS